MFRCAGRRKMVAAILTTSVLAAPAAIAELRAVAIASAGAEATERKGFELPGIDDALLRKLADLDRHIEARAWERAFQIVGEFMDSPTTLDTMAPGGEGFYVPLRLRLWHTLAALPPDGRDAYRLFFDASARRGVNQLHHTTQPFSQERIDGLKRLNGLFFGTGEGVRIANELAEVHYARGEFAEAASGWGDIIAFHPAAEGLATIELKHAAAVLHARGSAAFEPLRLVLSRRYANRQFTIAGQQVSGSAYLDRLAKTAKSQDAPDAGASEGPGEPPIALSPPVDGADPLWRCVFLPDAYREMLDQTLANWWGPNGGLGSYVPPHATDGKRLYCNWLGVVFALDLKTGRMVWRSGPFSEIASRFNSFQNGTTEAGQYTVAFADGVVVATLMPFDRINNWNEPFRAVAYDAKTGNPLWESAKAGMLQSWDFTSNPLMLGDQMLITAHPHDQNQHNAATAPLKLLSIELKTGKLTWQAELGKAIGRTNHRGVQQKPRPLLTQREGMVYILTNNGALLAFDPETQRTKWAYTYDPPVGTGQAQQHWNNGQAQSPELSVRGRLLIEPGMIVLHEPDNIRIHAIDPQSLKTLWSRPVPEGAALLGVDDDFVYVMERELLAIRRNSRSLAWATRLPPSPAIRGLGMNHDKLMVRTSRGMYELAQANGDIKHITRLPGPPSQGGVVYAMGDMVLCITDRAVTAWPAAPIEDQP